MAVDLHLHCLRAHHESVAVPVMTANKHSGTNAAAAARVLLQTVLAWDSVKSRSPQSSTPARQTSTIHAQNTQGAETRQITSTSLPSTPEA